MGKDSGDQVKFVCIPFAGGDVAKRAFALEFGEQVLLLTATVMKRDDRLHRLGFIGDDDLVIVSELPGLEQIQLHRFALLAGVAQAHEYKAGLAAPALWLPSLLESLRSIGAVQRSPRFALCAKLRVHVSCRVKVPVI